MPLTGRRIIQQLKEVYDDTGESTGIVKPNIITEPEYVESSINLTACNNDEITAPVNQPTTTNEIIFFVESDAQSNLQINNLILNIDSDSGNSYISSKIFSNFNPGSSFAKLFLQEDSAINVKLQNVGPDTLIVQFLYLNVSGDKLLYYEKINPNSILELNNIYLPFDNDNITNRFKISILSNTANASTVITPIEHVDTILVALEKISSTNIQANFTVKAQTDSEIYFNGDHYVIDKNYQVVSQNIQVENNSVVNIKNMSSFPINAKILYSIDSGKTYVQLTDYDLSSLESGVYSMLNTPKVTNNFTGIIKIVFESLIYNEPTIDGYVDAHYVDTGYTP